MHRSRIVSLPALMVLAVMPLLMLGCSREEPRVRCYPVRGQVFWKGQPAVKAQVIFHPTDGNQSFRPHASVQADGSFQLSSYLANDGAPAGTYRVTIIWPQFTKEGDDSGENEGPDRLGNRFSDPNRPGWPPIEVKPGPNELAPFEVGG